MSERILCILPLPDFPDAVLKPLVDMTATILRSALTASNRKLRRRSRESVRGSTAARAVPASTLASPNPQPSIVCLYPPSYRHLNRPAEDCVVAGLPVMIPPTSLDLAATDSCSRSCSSTSRTARSHISGEYRLGRPIHSILPTNKVSGKPGTVQFTPSPGVAGTTCTHSTPK